MRRELAYPLLAALLAAARPAASTAPTTPTDIAIGGGAAPASQHLPAGQAQFGLRVPLRPNAENTVTLSAMGGDGTSAMSPPFRITQLSLTDIVRAQVTAARLPPDQVRALVADGTINVSDPANFNVSMFVIVLTINGRDVPIEMPIVRPVDEPMVGTGAPFALVCASAGQGLSTTEHSIAIPCGSDGGGSPTQPPVEIIPFVIDLPDRPEVPPIPGVIVIEGKIKTLKEFFKVNLILSNVSTLFTLTDLTALLEVPPGALTPIVPASGPIMLDDLPPQQDETGHFIVRGDQKGVHTVTVHFGGSLTGLGIDQPIPISGSASTDLEVKGPPRMDVKVSHPDFVVGGVPYTLTVDITNTDPELPALFTSFELDVGADARLLDPSTREPLEGPSVQSLGDLLPGQSAMLSFTVLPLKTGPITSCTAGASENLHLTVEFVGGPGPTCAIGTFPSQRTDADGRPTVVVVPPHNTTDVTIDPAVTAIFSAPMLPETITTGFRGATFVVTDPTGALVDGSLQIAALGSGNTLAIFRPTNVLAHGTTYTITILPTIFDQNGLGLAAGLTARFTTVGAPAVPDTVSPQVTLLIEPPVSPGAVPQGQLVPVRVDATDDVGVTRVDLLLDGVFVDTHGPASPVHFMLDTAGLAPGTTHTLRAVAFDARGNSGAEEATFAMAPDTEAPTVQITTRMQVLEGRTLPVTVDATDNGHVARIDLFLDDGATPVAHGMMTPFQVGLPTGALAAGDHRLRASATDGAGNVGSAERLFHVTGDTQPPVVVVLSPAPNAEVRAGTRLAVAAVVTDDVGVDTVQFFLDAEVAPRATGPGGFTLDTAPLPLGPHAIRVDARDTSGNPANATVQFALFTVPPDTTPPAAPDAGRITASVPAGGTTTVTGGSGAVESGAAVEVLDTASQATNTVAAGGDGSFRAALDAAGGEQLRIVAIDAAGNRSPPTTIVVPLPPTLVSLSVSPPAVSLGRTNPSQQLTVTGNFDDGSHATLTAGVFYGVDDPTIAAPTATGLVLPGVNGVTTIHVIVAGVPRVDVPVTVDFPTVVGAEVTPASVHLLDIGAMQPLSVAAVLSDGSRTPFPGTVGFGAQDVTVATATSGGLVTGVGEGSTAVLVSAGAFPVISVPVTVERARLVSLNVSPGAVTLVGRGATQPLSVSGHFSDGSDRPVASPGFQTSDAAIAAVDAAGVIRAGNDGDAQVTVTVNGAPPAMVPVHVKSFASIALDPASFQLIGTGKTRQLAVTARFTDGSTTTLGSGVLFGSDKTAIATVDANGVVTSASLGTATITGTFQSFSAQALVTVIARQAVGITSVPPSVLLTAAGQKVTLQVQASFNDGSTGPLTDPVNFTSLDTTVATVSAGGEVTAVANGNTSIHVTSGSLLGTVPVTVDIPVANPPPHIDAIDRPRAGEGDPFVIRGAHFAAVPGDNLVQVNGLPATVQAARQDELSAVVPRGATTGPVLVTVNGQASNPVDLGVYARRAQSRPVTSAFDLPASPGDMATFDVPAIDVESDLVFLSSAPDVLAPLAFTGTLTASVDGGAPFAIPPSASAPDLTAHFPAGVHSLTVKLTATGSRVQTGPIFLVVGPDGTGAIAGERTVVALAQSHPIPVTVQNLTDLAGNPLPDGSQVAVTVQQIGVVTRDGCCFVTSIGGTIVNGTPTPNDGRFETFTVTGGRIDVVYDPAGAGLATGQGGVANVQVVPADAGGNVGAFHAIAVEPVTLTTFDTAASARSQSAVVADGLAKVATVTLSGFRDTAGNLVPDGTRVAVTVQQIGVVTPDGCCFVASAGGSITNGVATPNDGRFRTFTVTGGQVVIAYDPSPVELGTADVRTTNFQVLPADASGNQIGSRAFSVTPLTLSSPSAQPANVDVSPASVLADTADNRAVITLTHIADVLGSPVPDGTQVAVTVQQIGVVTPDGCCFVNSAGGTIIGGTATPNDNRFRTFTVTGGQVQIVYSSLGVSVGVRQSATSRVQILPADAGGNRIGSRAFAVADVTLTGYETATATVVPTSVVADGLPKTVTITLTGILDTAGNPVPDGSNVAVTASQIGVVTPDGCCFVNSRGGTITNGTVTPNDGRFRTLTVSGGQVVIDYDPSPVELQAADVQTANIQILPADASGNVLGSRAFTVAPVTLSSPTAQPMHVVVTPPSVLADDADNHVIVTVSNITDALGRPVPDGTKVAATVRQIGVVTPDGCCFVNSAGGTVVGGTTAVNDSRFQVFTVTGGQVQIVYSTLGVEVGVRQPATATMQLLPADPSNNVLGGRAFAVAPITLAAYQDADVIGAGTVAPGGTATYVVQNIVDTSGNPVPDGAKIAVTVQQIGVVSPDGCCFVNSAGGTITNGGPSPSDGRFVSFTVQNGSLSIDFQAPAQAGVTSTLQLLPAEPSGNRIAFRAFAVKAIAIGP